MFTAIVLIVAVVASALVYFERKNLKADIEKQYQDSLACVRGAIKQDIDAAVADVKSWSAKAEAKPAEIIAQIEARIKQIL